VEYFLSEVSEVSVGWFLGGEALICPHPGLAHDDDVVTFSEGVSAEEYWFEMYL